MRSTFLSIVLASATLVACGGASDSGLFGGPTNGNGDVDPGGTDSGTIGHGGHDASGSDIDAGTGGGDTGGGTSDGGIDPLPDTGTVDAKPVIDAAPPPPDNPGIYCGDTNGNATYCKIGTPCCVKTNGTGQGGSGSACETTSVPFCSGVAVECDSDDDCNGQICCGTLVANSRYTSVRCQATCDTQTNTQVHFCDPNAQTDVCAADGLQCTESGILPGYYVCAN